MSNHPIEPQADVEALQPFVGKWHTEGERLVGSFGPAARLRAVEVFEWLEGGFFLVHRFNGQFDESPAGCIEIIGRCGGEDLTVKTFYSDGTVQDWALTEQNNRWTLQGKWRDRQGKMLDVRNHMTFEDLGNTLVSEWSYSPETNLWQPFLRSRATKALPLPDTSIG
jgi:hypothetical protein